VSGWKLVRNDFWPFLDAQDKKHLAYMGKLVREKANHHHDLNEFSLFLRDNDTTNVTNAVNKICRT